MTPIGDYNTRESREVVVRFVDLQITAIKEESSYSTNRFLTLKIPLGIYPWAKSMGPMWLKPRTPTKKGSFPITYRCSFDVLYCVHSYIFWNKESLNNELLHLVDELVRIISDKRNGVIKS